MSSGSEGARSTDGWLGGKIPPLRSYLAAVGMTKGWCTLTAVGMTTERAVVLMRMVAEDWRDLITVL
jgi:hypothetical protein